ncbi:hypothetical protein Acid345_0764 [Candidatus Koribacter versatilis Ellin345]|uniref:Kelch repeat protein n=1 Tax=Koribacter versatilis (strain Ellin345) TaxID=204669 RepID=Q1ITN1_KORVE|nr:kelch repeat-containing protein [Candidatus Koribacter versatilis]ABF39769.1 hypothetical protein Acid345_0764 [Candidatus Koribacter versatilis Ellin345]
MGTSFRVTVFALSVLALITLSGCGGSSTTSSSSTTYTIGGTISGLTGSGLVLQNNGGDNLTVSSGATTFTFATPAKSGDPYAVTVLTQPSGENCTVTGGSGNASANVTNVSIACVTAYSVGGQVLGLTGTGLVLQDNAGNDLTVSAGAASYAFVFSGTIPDGGVPYSITVFSNPSGQSCTVSNAVGTATADVANADVTCTTISGTTFTVGGTVSGLSAGTLILQDSLGVNNTDLLPLSGNGSFIFVNPVGSGEDFNVSVFSQPATRNCSVSNGAGIATANVTNVSVVCVGDFAWMGGSSTVGTNGGQPGVYGALGTPSPTNIPGGRQQPLTWTDASGNLWLFGGYGQDSTDSGGLLNDLWKYSPTSAEWTWMGGSTVAPPSTSFGAAGAPGVYGTIGVPDPANVPGGREQVATWTDASGRIWVFGGEGIDANGVTGELNDLWVFDPTLGATGEWTWMGGNTSVGAVFSGPSGVYGTLGVPDPANVPGGRYGAISWIDSSGNLWLFGGNSIDSTGTLGYLNDLWMFNPTLGAHGEWTWMAGGNVTANSGNGAAGVYGTLGVPDPVNTPGGRGSGVSWVDRSGNVWLFGGLGADSVGNPGFLNDLWRYTPGGGSTVGQWTWMSGSNTVPPYSGQPGIYGSLGTASAANAPGGRFSGLTWLDASGKLWLFSGNGYDSAGVNGYLNDLWQFDPSAGTYGEWTWMGGSSSVGRSGGQLGVYGTLGIPAATNSPGGRFGVAGWVDPSGNFWFMGGDGYDSVGNQGNLNDLWMYQP